MTERLYYRDSFRHDFDAQVVCCEPAGKVWHVELDHTAFYPASGGQPCDTGKLGDATVVNVFERDDEAVIHVTSAPVGLGSAHGTIDWDRRFDHMQQHTGQHLLSAAFIELFKFSTVSFHLGREVSTIDLAAPAVSSQQLEEAERRTNQIIFEDRSVTVRFGTAQELAEAGIRNQVDREGVLRAIEIEGFDRQPCGGTHVSRTGQIGLILLRKCEKVKQNWRIEFVCGGRALRVARADYAILGEVARLLSCGIPEVPAMLARALAERQESYRARQRLKEQLAEAQAQILLHNVRSLTAGEPRLILHVFEDADADYLRLLAAKLVAEPGIQALLGARPGGRVVFAQSLGLAADMNALLRECVQSAGGKGGGTRNLAQGSIPNPEALETVLHSAVERVHS